MSDLISFKELFTNKIIRVPDYQRGYAWKEDHQLEDFWNDIENLPDGKNHYTGMISLKKMTDGETNELRWLLKSDKGYVPYHVVDGQQRLTTFIILLKCIMDKVKKDSSNDEKEIKNIQFADTNLGEISENIL